MQEPTSQPHPQHSPGAPTARDCNLCASLRHPAMAAEGRKLTKHLATNPLPRQAAAA